MNCIALILFEGWLSVFNVYVWVCAPLARSGIERVITGQSYAVRLQIKMVGVSVFVVTWGGEILS